MPTQPFIRTRFPTRLPSSAGRVVGAGLVLAGLFFGGMTAKDMGYANGHRGDAGTLTVQECRTQFDRVGSSRHRHARPVVTCTGAFQDDEGGAAVEDATVETGAKFEPGKQLAVQKTDYKFVMIEEQWIWRSLAIVGVSVCAIVAGLFCLLTGFGTRRGPGFRDAWHRVPGGTVVRAVLAGAGGLAALGAAAALLVDGLV
ncbi:hypothetical protein A6A06_36145 [Streptomyces sp. CB02923]|uniref:hypothetical protein n=1 Tax=Streptomyces sp. CB02923 TaxID=1718985 RepID=UPI00093B9995|nr:hypothetical protein [Streptomyces sp. CB02923]OKI07136.1 hypothetical protein A6A06_36145 [Streptomyces sp. CB02923]